MATAILESPGTLEDPVVPSAPRMGADGRPRRRGRQIAAGVVVALVLGTEAVLAAPYLGSAMAVLAGAADEWVGLAMFAAAGSLTAFALVRRALLRAAGVGVSTGSALASSLVANAFHMTLPGGVAFSTAYAYRWMQRHGAGPTVAGWNLAVSGLLSTAGLAALGVSASLLVGSTSWARTAVEIIVIAVLVFGVGHLVRDPNRALAAAGRVLAAVNQLRHRPPAAGADRLARIAEQLHGGAADRRRLDGRHRLRAAELAARPRLPGRVRARGRPDRQSAWLRCSPRTWRAWRHRACPCCPAGSALSMQRWSSAWSPQAARRPWRCRRSFSTA